MVTLEEIKKSPGYEEAEKMYDRAFEYARKCDLEKTFSFYDHAVIYSWRQLEELYEKYPDDIATIIFAFSELAMDKREELAEILKNKCGCRVERVIEV